MLSDQVKAPALKSNKKRNCRKKDCHPDSPVQVHCPQLKIQASYRRTLELIFLLILYNIVTWNERLCNTNDI